MSKYDDMLVEQDAACKAELEVAKTNLKDAIEPKHDKFRRGNISNIEQQFGEFLYTALGDRVTGQRVSVLNETYLAGNAAAKKLVTEAETNGTTVEEEAKKHQVKYNSMLDYEKRWTSAIQPQIYLTVGRKFGVSYLTGDGTRTHTIYFGAGQCFEHLTQEHVDSIKNKQKRECAQSFLTLRDDFVGGIKDMVNQLIPVNVTVQLGKVSNITKSPKVNSDAGGYRDTNTRQYMMLDEIVDSKITHMIATVQDVNIWDKKTDVRSSEVKSEKKVAPVYVSLMFLNINDLDKTVQIIGNIDLSMDEVRTSLCYVNEWSVRDLTNHLDCVVRYHYNFLTHPALHEYKSYTLKDADGVPMNLHEVLENPTVKNEFDRRVNFYADMYERLMALKHENADLYFINADI